MERLGKQFYRESNLRQQFMNFSATSSESARLLLNESTMIKSHYDFFLSHSSSDRNIAYSLYKELINKDFVVFMDIIDERNTNIEQIASNLKNAMNKLTYILYLHSHNAQKSRWTPWEIGYFDAKKGKDKVFMMPTLDDNKSIATYEGQEYLQAYTELGVDYLENLKSKAY